MKSAPVSQPAGSLKSSVVSLLLISFTLSLLGLCDCSKSPSATAPIVPTAVQISLKNRAGVGEWISLQASQTAGGVTETNVQASLFWLTDATNMAKFNVPTLASASRNPFTREVSFGQPGTFRIWAIAAPGITSNVETVTVTLSQ